MRCGWIEDITYMRKPDPGCRRQLMVCGQDVTHCVWDGAFPTDGLCKHHYEGKVYRGEDVSQYEPYSLPRHLLGKR